MTYVISTIQCIVCLELSHGPRVQIFGRWARSCSSCSAAGDVLIQCCRASYSAKNMFCRTFKVSSVLLLAKLMVNLILFVLEVAQCYQSLRSGVGARNDMNQCQVAQSKISGFFCRLCLGWIMLASMSCPLVCNYLF